MTQPIAKVRLDDIRSFLSRRAEEWDLEGLEGFEDYLPSRPPVIVDELIVGFQCANQNNDYVYLFCVDELMPFDAASHADLDAIPLIDEREIANYEVRSGSDRDFLYVAPTIQDVANGFYVNLMPHEPDEEPVEAAAADESGPSEPCITAMTVSNFKGIGSPLRIEFEPITMVYGPNSAGKSSILHAILYALEILDKRNLDPINTTAGGALVDLGGFASLVHNHDRSNPVTLRFEMNVGNEVIRSYSSAALRRRRPAQDATESLLPDFAADIRTATVSLSVAWSEIRGKCFVQEYGVELNGHHVASIRCDFGRRDVTVSDLNFQHPIFRPGFAGPGAYCGSDEDSLASYWLRNVRGEDEVTKPLAVIGQRDALPHWGRMLDIDLGSTETDGREDVDASATWEAQSFFSALTQLLVGPGELLCDLLRKFCYLGPLRKPPARNFAVSRSADPARWADGMAAWDALLEEDRTLAERVSDWLSDPERLGTGYRLEVKSYRELNEISPLMGMLLSEAPLDDLADVRAELEKLPVRKRLVLVETSSGIELQPCDVGAGISQVVPVVVLALHGAFSFASIEHPELHVHPRVQAKLGDLFIWSINERPSARFLLESHSEHLLLRFLRRIRETDEGELTPGIFPSLEPEQLAVYYVENQGGRTVATRLRIDNTGEFIDRWPNGFFEERVEELF
jgi:hypothetical protein